LLCEQATDRFVASKGILGNVDRTRWIQVKKFCDIAITSLFALVSAAIVAYSTAHFVHYVLGFSRSALREQALICAALIVGVVTIEKLASTKHNK
jgi:hypothetical protein